jgi:hypothetical protein
MKSAAGMVVAVLSLVGLLVMVPLNVFPQAPGYGMNPVSKSAVYQPVDAAVPVHAALDQFDSALAAHDVDKLQATGVKPAGVKLWQKFFRENPGATVTDRCPASELTVSDDTASWICTETVTIIFEGKPLAFPHVIHFTFARIDGNWIIADRR